MRRILLVVLALGALFLPDVSRAGSCNSANGCATLEHDSTTNAVKTVNVDATGTALVGGSGSRVELLYSGTTTTADTTYLDIVPAVAMPAWVTRVQFVARIRAITLGPGATWATNAYISDANGILTSVAGNKMTFQSASIASPAAGNGFLLSFGSGEPNVVGALMIGVVIGTYPLPLRPKIGFTSKWTTAPTDWTLDWYVYGIGG